MTAIFSPDRKYRYTLSREFVIGEGTVLFVLLNPSTADETQNDPTVRRCIGFATQWGFQRLLVGNIFALRSTDPKGLVYPGLPIDTDPVGVENDHHLAQMAKESEMIVCGWGNWGEVTGRGDQVREMLVGQGHPLHHLGLNQSGQPKHPLYLASDTEPVRF